MPALIAPSPITATTWRVLAPEIARHREAEAAEIEVEVCAAPNGS